MNGAERLGAAEGSVDAANFTTILDRSNRKITAKPHVGRRSVYPGGLGSEDVWSAWQLRRLNLPTKVKVNGADSASPGSVSGLFHQTFINSPFIRFYRHV